MTRGRRAGAHRLGGDAVVRRAFSAPPARLDLVRARSSTPRPRTQLGAARKPSSSPSRIAQGSNPCSREPASAARVPRAASAAFSSARVLGLVQEGGSEDQARGAEGTFPGNPMRARPSAPKRQPQVPPAPARLGSPRRHAVSSPGRLDPGVARSRMRFERFRILPFRAAPAAPTTVESRVPAVS